MFLEIADRKLDCHSLRPDLLIDTGYMHAAGNVEDRERQSD